MKYLIMAHRFRTDEYIFPVGIFDTEDKAIMAAEFHRNFRGGKYDHRLYYIEREDVIYDAEEIKYRWVTGKKIK